MGNWGIAETAPTKEKIKSEFFDVLNGLNCTGAIDYVVYSELFDEFEKVAEKLTQLEAEKSGEWLKGTGYLPTRVCSVCKEEYAYIAFEKNVNLNHFDYCPNCGAKMEEVKHG